MMHRVAGGLLIYLGYALFISFLHWDLERTGARRWWSSLRFGFTSVGIVGALLGVIVYGLYLLAIA